MSKILDASCSATGVVSAEGVTVPAATVLSEGKQASTGLLFLEDEKARYLPSSATDIKTTLEKLVLALTSTSSALTTIASALTAIGTGMTGPTTAPPMSLPASVSAVNALASSIDSIKEQLDTLKGTLK
jgi:hypothetical protein